LHLVPKFAILKGEAIKKRVAMQEQICEWLGLDAHSWPPDHYTLLGLKREEGDPQVIEQRVHERMQRVRPFQLAYPDQVTEALNHLARAYSCLSDPAARAAYDKSLTDKALPQRNQAEPANASMNSNDPLAWLLGPWDRLVEPESGSGPSSSLPYFRDWAASSPPPRQRKSSPASEIIFEPQSPADRMGQTVERSAAVWWRHSGLVLLVLSMMALAMAAWRQWGH
jgi:hypothetical protein